MQKKVSVSILCHDLSNNALGRAFLLGRLLQPQFRVTIIGPVRPSGIWEPLRHDASVRFKAVPFASGLLGETIPIFSLLDAIDGDIIYSVKPLPASFGIGLIASLLRRKPLILDIDDWEIGFLIGLLKERSVIHNLLSLLKAPFSMLSPGNIFSMLLSENLTFLASATTVSNTFLQRRYGGFLLPHVRDTDSLRPSESQRDSNRTRLGISTERIVVLFFGTPRPHKGMEELTQAIRQVPDRRLCLIFAGIDAKDAYAAKISRDAKEMLGDRFIKLGVQPFADIADILSIADIVALPQAKNDYSNGQLPAKIFDAMAMGKAIIATDTNDIPIILAHDCGILIDDTSKLSLAIAELLYNPLKRERLGMNARKRCESTFSWAIAGPALRDMVAIHSSENLNCASVGVAAKWPHT